MTGLLTYALLAAMGLAGLGVVVFAILKGWQGWLELKRLELSAARGGEGRGPAMERIEIADIKERLRKLEAIAACVDL